MILANGYGSLQKSYSLLSPEVKSTLHALPEGHGSGLALIQLPDFSTKTPEANPDSSQSLFALSWSVSGENSGFSQSPQPQQDMYGFSFEPSEVIVTLVGMGLGLGVQVPSEDQA